MSPLTTYMVPKPEEVNLLTGESATQVSPSLRLPAEGSPASSGIHTCMSLFVPAASAAGVAIGKQSDLSLFAYISVFQLNNCLWVCR